MEFYVPYLEVLGMKPYGSLKDIKNAGFDGAEGFLIGGLRSVKRAEELVIKASEIDLGLRFHQGWTYESGQPNLFNYILGAVGALVSKGMSLEEQFSPVAGDHVVVYGNWADHSICGNYLYQTASQYQDGRFGYSFGWFVERVKEYNLPVVFDTQHVLEWFWNKKNVSELPMDVEFLKKTICKLWKDLRPFVKEIHLCDFNPYLGGSLGRNVFPGTGIFPIKEFFAEVRASNWDGIITPEVNIRHMKGSNSLKRLREVTEQLYR
jgi:Xylose isomerase-like TIM barrel